MNKEFYGHGKLLLTSEYLVLDGANALALPTKFGQKLLVKKARGADLIWESLDQNGDVWFDAQISLYDFSAIKTSDEDIALGLKKILKNAVRLNSEFLSKWNGFKVETQLEFPREWGLGTSSTLIHTVAEWADINPLLLHFRVSDGSGYDIACASADGPIVYQTTEDEINYKPVDFKPSFRNQLYFVYSGNKADSKEAIVYYSKKVKSKKSLAKKASEITEQILSVKSFDAFSELVVEHEKLLSAALNMPTIKEDRFPDFWGAMKSLGAWGGDFALVCSDRSKSETKAYFKSKGLETVLTYDELIL